MVQNIANSPDVVNVTNRLSHIPQLHSVWSSDSLSAPRGCPDVYQTVRHRRSESPESSVYETITSYYGKNRVTHKIIKRAQKLSVLDETEIVSDTKEKSPGNHETDSVRNKKKLKLKIPKVQFRTNNDASASRTFIVTAVQDSTDNDHNETEDKSSSEKDKLM